MALPRGVGVTYTTRKSVTASISLTTCTSRSLRGTVAYVRKDGLWFQDLAAGETRKVASGAVSMPKFSPSGRWIAYVRGKRSLASDTSILFHLMYFERLLAL
jgi:hypothetical protein